MIIEMRTYQLKPGMREPFLEVFRSKSMPAHAEIGMRILGPFISIEDPDTFFFMRGFPDLESRNPMKDRFYEEDLWKRELESVLMPMIERYDVVLVEDPEGLVKWPERPGGRGHGGSALATRLVVSPARSSYVNRRYYD